MRLGGGGQCAFSFGPRIRRVELSLLYFFFNIMLVMLVIVIEAGEKCELGCAIKGACETRRLT